MQVPECDRRVGIEVYATKEKGIGGQIKKTPEDFIVEEVLNDKTLASVVPLKNGKNEIVGKGENLVCCLVKKNWSTLLAIREIAKKLRIGEKRIRFAGIKDRRAITAQHISIWNIAPKEIRQIKIKDIWLWPLRYSTRPIKSLDIFGNLFKINIRNVGEANLAESINQAFREAETLGGMPNFYGYQRFSTITHVVGKKIIQGRLGDAVKTYLTAPRLKEREDAAEARAELEKTLDYKEGLKNFPTFLKFEVAILNYLTKHPTDYVGALRVIPRKLGRLFVHAYQAYLFNRLLSEKLHRGDSLKDARVGDHIVQKDPYETQLSKIKKVTSMNLKKRYGELQRGRAFLVLPIFGYTSEAIEDEEEQSIFDEEEINIQSFRVLNMKELSTKGTYRPIAMSVNDLKTSIINHSSLNQDSTIVKLSFSLRRGEYASILLRELMKPQKPLEAGF